MGGSVPPSNTWFRGPTQVLNPNGSSIGATVFAWLTSVTGWRRVWQPVVFVNGSINCDISAELASGYVHIWY